MSNTNMMWIIGILVGLVIAVIIIKAFNNDNKAKTEYDERQLKARGEAYKYAFFSILGMNVVMMLLEGTKINDMLGTNKYFIPIFVGLVVQITISIFKDAYIGLNTNMKKFAIVMTVISLFNLGIAAIAFFTHTMVENGVFQSPFTNLLVGVLFVILAIEMGIKSAIDKREE